MSTKKDNFKMEEDFQKELEDDTIHLSPPVMVVPSDLALMHQ